MEELNEKLCMEKLDRILQRLDKLNLNDIESLKKYLLEIVLEKNPLNFEDMENLRKYLLSDILSHEQLDAFDLKVLQKMFISEKKFINDDGNANPDVCFERRDRKSVV